MARLIEVEKIFPEIVYLRFNRPEKRNALNISMMKQFLEEMEKIKSEDAARILVMMGKGESFCTGLDLEEASNLTTAEESAELIANVLRSIYECPLLTISSVHGHALAGGCGLAAISDYVIAEEGVFFGFPEVQRGLVASIVMAFLIRRFDDRTLRELFLFGECVETNQAKHMRLVNRVVKKGFLEEETKVFAIHSLRSAPNAVAQIKKQFRDIYPSSIEEDLNHALSLHKLARTHIESQEGIKAFLEKRKPKWTLHQ